MTTAPLLSDTLLRTARYEAESNPSFTSAVIAKEERLKQSHDPEYEWADCFASFLAMTLNRAQ